MIIHGTLLFDKTCIRQIITDGDVVWDDPIMEFTEIIEKIGSDQYFFYGFKYCWYFLDLQDGSIISRIKDRDFMKSQTNLGPTTIIDFHLINASDLIIHIVNFNGKKFSVKLSDNGNIAIEKYFTSKILYEMDNIRFCMQETSINPPNFFCQQNGTTSFFNIEILSVNELYINEVKYPIMLATSGIYLFINAELILIVDIDSAVYGSLVTDNNDFGFITHSSTGIDECRYYSWNQNKYDVFILSGFNSLHKVNKTIIVGNIYDEFYELSKVSEQYTPKIITSSFHLNRPTNKVPQSGNQFFFKLYMKQKLSLKLIDKITQYLTFYPLTLQLPKSLQIAELKPTYAILPKPQKYLIKPISYDILHQFMEEHSLKELLNFTFDKWDKYKINFILTLKNLTEKQDILCNLLKILFDLPINNQEIISECIKVILIIKYPIKMIMQFKNMLFLKYSSEFILCVDNGFDFGIFEILQFNHVWKHKLTKFIVDNPEKTFNHMNNIFYYNILDKTLFVYHLLTKKKRDKIHLDALKIFIYITNISPDDALLYGFAENKTFNTVGETISQMYWNAMINCQFGLAQQINNSHSSEISINELFDIYLN